MAYCKVESAILDLRNWGLPLLVGLIVGSTPLWLQAADIHRTTSHPGGFSEVETEIDAIVRNLSGAQCGGWNLDDEITNFLGQGKVALVTGVPGHSGEPIAHPTFIKLGMAYRHDQTPQDFQYPDDPATCGFTTACRPLISDPSRRRPNFWSSRRADPNTGRPLPDLHPCQRPIDGHRPDDYAYTGSHALQYSCGGGDHGKIRDPLNGFCNLANVGIERDDINLTTPGLPPTGTELDEDTAGGFCQKLNEDWVYTLWRKPICFKNGGLSVNCGADDPLAGHLYRKGGPRAFDQQDEQLASPWERHSIRYACSDGVYGGDTKNCILCEGRDCKCEGPDCTGGLTAPAIQSSIWIHLFPDYLSLCPTDPSTCDKPLDTQEPPLPYYSFHRHYTASYYRDTVDVVEDDHAYRDYIPVACFGLWHKTYYFDPRDEHLRKSYWNCVIATYYPEDEDKEDADKNPWFDQHFREMDETQLGTGSGYTEATYNPGDKQRTDSKPNEDGDPLWEQELSTAFSVLNQDRLEEEYDDDLTVPLLNPDQGTQRATVQNVAYGPSSQSGNQTVYDPLFTGALLHAFDDSVDTRHAKRAFTEWWQEQQTRAHTLFTPPTLTVTLPPAWSIDLDPLNPIFSPPLLEEEEEEDGDEEEVQPDLLSQSIELQLSLREDVIGDIAALLQKGLLSRIEQRPVRIVVPTGDPNEYRSLAQGWCTWWRETKAEESSGGDGGGATVESCDGMDDVAKDMHDRLTEYADRIDDYRELRTLLPNTLSGYIALQAEIQDNIAEWVLRNAEAYKAYRDEQQKVLDLQHQWGQVQEMYRKVHDDTNTPWCKNDRFTVPIYALLDPWWPRADGTLERDLTGDLLPKLPDVPLGTDLVLDLSQLAFSTGTVQVPVVEPVQLSLNYANMQAPISLDAEPEEATIPEKLPELPEELEVITENVPEVKVETGELIEIADIKPDVTGPIDEATTQISEIKEIMRKMNLAYEHFWDTLLIEPDDVDDGHEEDCYEFYSDRCYYNEFSMIEYFTRIGARPAVLLKEDLRSIGSWRQQYKVEGHDIVQDCNPEDWACILTRRREKFPRQGWTIFGPYAKDEEDWVEQLQLDLLTKTLLEPAEDTDADALKYSTPFDEVLPTFNVPEDIYLIPQPNTSTGSNQP